MTFSIKSLLPAVILAVAGLFLFSGCTKEVPKEMLDSNKQQVNKQQMPDDSIHRNLMPKQETGETETSGEDSKKLSEKLTKDADDADAKYAKSKSEADRKVCIEKQMEAANYLMFIADLPPKQKYRPALRRYRRVLEIDPNNVEAAQNKKQIEDIYQSMGMPIPD
jgi:tetratricopeptide (TPR) repeat protein